MVEILRTQTLTDAYGLEIALKAAGIDALVQGQHTVAIIGGGVTVSVNETDAARARAVLQEFRQS